MAMTKKEIIERYGQAYYDAHLAKTCVNAKAWYWANPERRKTAAESTAAVKAWRLKNLALRQGLRSRQGESALSESKSRSTR